MMAFFMFIIKSHLFKMQKNYPVIWLLLLLLLLLFHNLILKKLIIHEIR